MADARARSTGNTVPSAGRAARSFRIEGGRPLRGTVRVSGAKNAALKLLAAATLTGERCRFTNVPEIEDVRVMAETLRDLGVVVDHPEPNVYEVASGDVDWLFVPLEAAAKMRASVHPPRAAARPLRAGDHQQPGRRPDRPAAGRPPRRRDAGARAPRSTTATATTSRRRPAGCAAREVRFPFVSVMGTENAMLAATLADGHTVIRPAAQEPEVDDLIAFLAEDGRRGRADRPGHDRGRGPRRLRGAEHRVIPDRIEAGTFLVAAAVTGGQVDARGRAVRPPRGVPRASSARSGVAVACGTDTIEVDARRSARGGFARGRHRDRRRTRASRPTSSRRRACC